MAVLKRTRMPQDATFPTGRCDCTPVFPTSSNLVGYSQRGRADAYPNPNPNPPKGYARPRLFSLPSKRRKRPLRQLCLCLAAKPALPRRSALHEAEAIQTRVRLRRPQARPASLNSQVTAPRRRQSSLAPWMRRQHCRRCAPPPRPAAASPGRCCGPVRGAAVPPLITSPAIQRSLDILDVTAQLPRYTTR